MIRNIFNKWTVLASLFLTAAPAIAEPVDGLIPNLEQAILSGLTQFEFMVLLVGSQPFQPPVEDLKTAAALLPGNRHGEVGVAQQRIGILVIGPCHGHANARSHANGMAVDRVHLFEFV